MMSKKRIRVMVVEDHTIVREGLVSLLQNKPDLDLVGECGTGIEALKMAKEVLPDLVILDLTLPDMSGIEVLYELREEVSSASVLVLSMHDEPEYVKPALNAGARGYLVKGSGVGDLYQAIQAIAKGEFFLSPSVAEVALGRELGRGVDRLSSREEQVLRFVAQGKTSKEIGIILGISPKTVDNHRLSIMQKTDTHDIASLTRLAIRSGFLPPD